MNEEIFEDCKMISEGYEPYTGGGGPSEEQVRKNNQALQIALQKVGIRAKLIRTDFDGSFDEEIEVLELAPGVTIGYDRWGFVGTVLKGRAKGEELDQDDLEDAVAWAKRNTED